jgi:hypothetical protein
MTADEAVTVLRQLRHEADGRPLPPSPHFGINIVQVVGTALSGDHAGDDVSPSGEDRLAVTPGLAESVR